MTTKNSIVLALAEGDAVSGSKILSSVLNNLIAEKIEDMKTSIFDLDEGTTTKGAWVKHAKSSKIGKVANVSGDKSIVNVKWNGGDESEHEPKELIHMKEDEILIREYEELDEVSKARLDDYVKKSTTNKGLYDKINSRNRDYESRAKSEKRQKGISSATSKLAGSARVNAKESEEFDIISEFEQLDEVSKARLGDYIKHSSMNKSSHANDIGYENGSGVEAGHKDFDRQNKANKQHGKRSLGIDRAVDKLTGKAKINAKESEEFEQLDEISTQRKLDYATKAVDHISSVKDRVKDRMARHGSITAKDQGDLDKVKDRQKHLKKALGQSTVNKLK